MITFILFLYLFMFKNIKLNERLGNDERSIINEIEMKRIFEINEKKKVLAFLQLNEKSIYEKIYKECGVKIVLDIHHHRFRSDESLESAADLAFSTWGTEKPKVHYSESAQDKMPQAHSDFIENRIPELSKSVYYDVMIEAKQKDKALLKYRNIYNAS